MTISEVSEKYEITSHTLRYYERVGLIPDVCRTAGGRRDYTDEDCSWVEFIKCMRSAGLSVEVLIEYVALCSMEIQLRMQEKSFLLSREGSCWRECRI